MKLMQQTSKSTSHGQNKLTVSQFQLTTANKSTLDACWPRFKEGATRAETVCITRRTHLVLLSSSKMVHVPHSWQLLLIVPVHGTLRTASVRILPGCSNTSPSSFSLTWGRVSSSVWAETEGYLPVRAAACYPERRRPPATCLRFRPSEEKKEKEKEAGCVFLSPAARVSLPQKRKVISFQLKLPLPLSGKSVNRSFRWILEFRN